MLEQRILTYLGKHDTLVPYEKLASVVTQAGFSVAELTTALTKLAPHLLTTSTPTGIIYYKLKPTAKTKWTYPTCWQPCPFLVCDCGLWHVHWEPSLGHFPTCDSVKHPQEYKKQNPHNRTAGVAIDEVEYQGVVAKAKAMYQQRKPKWG